MRKTYIADKVTGELILKEEWVAKYGSNSRGSTSPLVMPDIPDFVSPVDGKIVHGRKSLREHNKRHNVTNVADFTNTWANDAKERARAYTAGSGYDSKRRIEHIVRAMEKNRR